VERRETDSENFFFRKGRRQVFSAMDREGPRGARGGKDERGKEARGKRGSILDNEYYRS